jgi:hypothetical protein
MARSSFVSFHYKRDHWRVQQVLRMGELEGQSELPAQEWESVKAKGDAAVHAWIDEQMKYKQAVIVLIGLETATRPFVLYEIRRAWQLGKPLLGINIHGLENSAKETDAKGANPFAKCGFKDSTRTFANYVPVFDPADWTNIQNPKGTDIYAAIRDNMTDWIAKGYSKPS